LCVRVLLRFLSEVLHTKRVGLPMVCKNSNIGKPQHVCVRLSVNHAQQSCHSSSTSLTYGVLWEEALHSGPAWRVLTTSFLCAEAFPIVSIELHLITEPRIQGRGLPLGIGLPTGATLNNTPLHVAINKLPSRCILWPVLADPRDERSGDESQRQCARVSAEKRTCKFTRNLKQRTLAPKSHQWANNMALIHCSDYFTTHNLKCKRTQIEEQMNG